MFKKVGVAGSTGFVGYNTVKRLLESGLAVRALVRKGSKSPRISGLEEIGAEIVEVDYGRSATLAEALRGCDVLYHFVGVSAQSSTVNVCDVNTHVTLELAKAARRSGVGAMIYNSGLGVNTHTTQSYFLSKLQAERIVRRSGLRLRDITALLHNRRGGTNFQNISSAISWSGGLYRFMARATTGFSQS